MTEGAHVQKDQDQVEVFLDNGWSVIGRMHRWLSISQLGPWEHSELVDVIGGLQAFWSSSEDLGLTRIAYSCLTLEQVLERFCAGTLEITAKHILDVTAGVELLQELLLGFEATRQEPRAFNLEVLHRLHKYTKEPICDDAEQFELVPPQADIGCAILANPTEPAEEPALEIVPVEADCVPAPETVKASHEIQSHSVLDRVSVESTVLAMLRQFVNKLDDTCHLLHERMVVDQTPYVTTTTRLEHLIQVTRELVLQLVNNHDSMSRLATNRLSLETETRDEICLDQTVVIDQAQLRSEFIESSPVRDTEEKMPSMLQSGFAAVEFKVQRVLIVEESLFYRQMISMAVRTMGYEPVVADSAATAIEILQQPQELRGVLVNASFSAVMSEVLQTCRRDKGMKVIGLLSTSAEEYSADVFDDQVARSNPSRLREILNRLMNANKSDTRRSA